MEKDVVAMGPLMNKRRRKRGNDEADANSPPKVLRKDHVAFRPTQSTLGGKSLALMGLEEGSTFFTPATQETPADAKSVERIQSAVYYQTATATPESRRCQSSRNTATEIPTEKVATKEKSSEPCLRPRYLTFKHKSRARKEIKAAFEEFKKYEDDKVEQRCAEMDASLDKLSVDFDEELYPHKLTVIEGHRWGIKRRPEPRSDGIPISVPTIAPQGLAILLADAATQTEVADEEDEPHPRLQRSISLPPFYNLEWK
ncbi:hypothetical protein Tco_1292958 [Tanacetum coccineum]